MRDEKWHGLTSWQAAQYRDGKSCEICGSENRLVVDHEHKTKAIRGVLCSTCNMIVGIVENKKKLKMVLAYIKRHASKPIKTAADFPRYRRPRREAPPHGTVSRYNYRFGKCRCSLCRAAVRDRERRINNRTPRPSNWGKPKHGTYAMYQQECKKGRSFICKACRQANRDWHNKRNAKIRRRKK